jgi:hypothetical protein
MKDDAGATRMIFITMLAVCFVVVGTVGFDIYQHPPGENIVGTAKVTISGNGRFEADVGTIERQYPISGTAPATIGVPYTRSDDLVANVKRAPGTVTIRVGCRTVAKGGEEILMWKIPRNWDRGVPRDFSKCS